MLAFSYATLAYTTSQDLYVRASSAKVTDESRTVKYSSGQGTVDEAAKAFSYDLASRTAHLAAGLDVSLQVYLHHCILTQALCEEYTYLGLFLFWRRRTCPVEGHGKSHPHRIRRQRSRG